MQAVEHKGSRREEVEDGLRGTDHNRETWDPLREMKRGREGVDTKPTGENIIILRHRQIPTTENHKPLFLDFAYSSKGTSLLRW